MKVTTISFDLYAWRVRMGTEYPITQAEAASLLGLSEAAYKRAERRGRASGAPCIKTHALLAQLLERRAA